MKRYILVLTTGLFLGSCASYKPDSFGVGTKDYNGRLNVASPHYKVKPSVAGYAGMLTTAVAGGYAAYNYKDGFITYYKNGERKNVREADAAIGALTSFTVAYLTHKLLFNTNSIKTDIQPNKWMKDAKIDANYAYLNNQNSNLLLIDKSYERNYTVRNYKDVLDFERAFPNSIRTDKVLKQAIRVVRRNELKTLISKYPKSAYINEMKYHYIDTSKDFDELLSYRKLYSNVKYNYSEKAKELISNYGDYKTYTTEYPDEKIKRYSVSSFVFNRIWDDCYASSTTEREFYSKLRSRLQAVKNINFTASLIKPFIRENLNNIVKRYVKLNVTKVSDSEISDDLEHYRNNTGLFTPNALMVQDSSSKKFLVEGVVDNKSYLSTSIKIRVKSNLIQQSSTKLKIFGATLRKRNPDKELGLLQETFKIDNFNGNTKSSFVVLLDSKKTDFSGKAIGITASFNYKLTGTYLSASYSSVAMTPSEKERQEKWLISGKEMLENNSSARSINHIGNLLTRTTKTYDKDFWDKEKEEARKSWAEALTNNSQTIDNSSNSNSNSTINNSNLNECDITKINIGINIPSVTKTSEYKGGWMGNYEQAEIIKFSDGIKGNIGYRKGKWYIRNLGVNRYYQSKTASIYALYFYKKCGFETTKDRIK